MRTYLHSVSTTSGFLQNCPVVFSPSLNCIIGARGTCKSTLIESIRFAFDRNPLRIEELTKESSGIGDQFQGMLRSTLGPGSVRCEVVVEGDEQTSRIALERELDAAPRVYLDNVREHADQSILQKIEIFSQGDLQRIAEDPNDELRLALVDRPYEARIRTLLSGRQSQGDTLLRLGAELRTLRAQISSLRQEIQPTPQLREQLRQVEANAPQLTPELEEERTAYDSRERALETLYHAVELSKVAVEELRPVTRFVEQLQSSRQEMESYQGTELDGILPEFEAIARYLGEIQERVHALAAIDLSIAVAEVQVEFENRNEKFYALRQAQQEVNESLKQQQHLRRQIEFLEKRQEILEAALKKEADLLSERQRARHAIAAVDNEIFALRVDEIEKINQEHGKRVHLALQSGTASKNLIQFLTAMLTGSRIRAQDEVASALGSTFTPSDLVDLVEAGDSQQIASVLNRDLGQMNRVVAHLSDHPELYRLEALVPKPTLDITLFDGGVPKPVETLSKGQKATALLPLILRPLPYPLLFDQPEDDLDNSFIFKSLIQTVLSLRIKRQIIFVTHNANIPVLGNADSVVVMSMSSPREANPAKIGTVDECKPEILDLLEGGIDAFRLREEKYHELLKSE